MKTILSLALLCFAINAHGATYLLLSQTNAFAAGITNEAKAYTDAHSGGGAIVGTLVNTNGPATDGAVMVASGVSGTNTIPASGVTVQGQTNVIASKFTGSGAALTNLTIAAGTPFTGATPVYLSWTNGPIWIGGDFIWEDFLSGTTPINGTFHQAGTGAQAFSAPSSRTGRNGFNRNVIGAPSGAANADYAAVTWWPNFTSAMWQNYYCSTEFTLGTSLTNILIQVGMMNNNYNSSNMTAGVIWELDQSKSTAFIARTAGASTWAWTNSTPAALNTWYKLSWYGSTNGVVFLINDVPQTTNASSATLPGYSATLGVQMRSGTSLPAEAGGANNIVYWDNFVLFSYQ